MYVFNCTTTVVCLCVVQMFSNQRLMSGVYLSVYVVVNKSVICCRMVTQPATWQREMDTMTCANYCLVNSLVV